MLVAKTALAAGKTVAVYFTPKLLTQIRQTYQASESEDAYDAFFKRLTSVDLLYIDDLGSERHTDWVVEQLYALVNERYENQRSMLVTSNAGNADQDIDTGRKRAGRSDRLTHCFAPGRDVRRPVAALRSRPARPGARGRGVEPGTIQRSCQAWS